MGLPTGEIQAALVTRLRGDTTLQGLLSSATAIFDEGGVPINTAFPYIATYTITSQSGTALAMGTDAVDTFIQVSIFTVYVGFKQARSIAKQVYALLQEKPLTLTGGFTNFFLLFDNEQELEEPDGITQQIVHRYKLMTTG